MSNSGMDPMAEIRQTFFLECEEQLAELETGLLAIEGGDEDPETVNAVFRAVHSIKGGAGAFSLDALVKFAHVFESALDHIRAGRMQPTPDVLRTMLGAADVLADLVCGARDDSAVDNVRVDALAEELRGLNGGGGDAAADAEPDFDFDFQPIQISFDEDDDFGQAAVIAPMAAPVAAPETANPQAGSGWCIGFTPKTELYAKANEPLLVLRELAQLGPHQISLNTGSLPLLRDLEPERAYIGWQIALDAAVPETAIQSAFEFVEWDSDITISAPDPAPAPNAAPAMESAPEFPPAHPEPAAIAAVAEIVAAAEPAPMPVAAPNAAPAPIAASTQNAEPQTKAAAGPATIRVDLDRVDRLINLLGELVINQAMLSQRVAEVGMTRSSGVAMCLDELEQLTREIQDSVMAIRAQPVKSVFQRMTRVAREAAAIAGKKAHLVFDGEATEVDKTVIERLSDPLTHMIRNAIDHGLEKPETRVEIGKAETGTIRLAASHRSGRVVIDVSDDGGGINRGRVRAIAVEKGLIAPDAVLSDEDTDNLIFLPGFSTAATISDISGRGVGMDVVRQSVQALGGRITISSRPGQGSTFSLSLPLTLAVLDGMVVTVGDQTLVIPLTAIIETLQPKSGSLHRLGDSERMIRIRDAYVPVIDLGAALGYAPPLQDEGVALFVECEGGKRAVLIAAAIQGQRQVVIKSLEANYQQVRGVAAATILGDGRVALILDVEAVVAMARPDESRVQRLALAG